ncbi:MAG: 2-oxoacid:acceptor oxidoreductase subunit alpha [Planctomycetota bacterium]
MTPPTATTDDPPPKPHQVLRSAVVRFAGDSGDGMQLAGTQFTDTSALAGNDVATLPDYPAEIRAPQGTVAGVSGFQVNFAAEDIFTPGDAVNALIAMNPAALKAHIADVEPGGIVVVNESEFSKINLKKAGYASNPLETDDDLEAKYQLFKVPITRLNQEALAESGLGAKDAGRCKNMWALGLIYWLYDRSPDATIKQLNDYFGVKKNKPEVAAANIAALKSGYYFGETAELFNGKYSVAPADIKPGRYRKVVGNEAIAMGLTAAAELAGKTLVYCSYPITPASTVLHGLANLKHHGVKTFQAEDEIAAVCAAIGASFAGQLGVTGTSGPGLALKAEAMGLAVMTELPLVVVNVQRGGPSTGLPTKTEQSDLLQAMYGRNGDCPCVVIAPQTPSDCFHTAIEAVRIATTRMVPVVLLTDGYLANGSEPWLIPDADSLEPIAITHTTGPNLGDNGESTFAPYKREDDSLARPWAIPGSAGTEHRIGGLEKQNTTGNVNYEPDNHQLMTALRQQKVERVVDLIPPTEVHGDPSGGPGSLLMLGWGGTFGSIHTATRNAIEDGKPVAQVHLRHLNPMPADLGDIVKRFDKVLIPELNTGQLRPLIRGKFLVDAKGLNKIQGKPFLVEELDQAIDLILSGEWPAETESIMPRDGVVNAAGAQYTFS